MGMDDGSFTRRTFSSTGSSSRDVRDTASDRLYEQHDDHGDEDQGEGVPRRVLIMSGTMGFLGCAGIMSGLLLRQREPSLAAEDATRLRSLRDQIDHVRAEHEALPEAREAQRVLSRVQDAGATVAREQNNYRYLIGRITPEGTLPSDGLIEGQRMLAPLFDAGMDRARVGPWYLLASDAEVSLGPGLPELFDSGFAWRALAPQTINIDGTVGMTWIATAQRAPGAITGALLAWAQADYDAERQVFTGLTQGVTVTGAALRAEVIDG